MSVIWNLNGVVCYSWFYNLTFREHMFVKRSGEHFG